MKKLMINLGLCTAISLMSGNVIHANTVKLKIQTKNSILRIGVEPLAYTDKGKKIADKLYDALEEKDYDVIKKISKKYASLQQEEDSVLDYSALSWLCDRIIEQKKYGSINGLDKMSEEYYEYFVKEDYKVLKEYLLSHYGIKKYDVNNQKESDIKRHTFIEELLLFNDPSRNKWDNTDAVISKMNIKNGERVVDVGAGFGFFSDKISGMVGENGVVYAVDTNDTYVNYIKGYVERNGIRNIKPIVSNVHDVVVNDKVDHVFMCSLYHIIYGWSQETNRKAFIGSIKYVLKKGGHFYIVDNKYGAGKEMNNCYIYKEAVISQLENYGFRFVKSYDISKRRYMLDFVYEESPENALTIADDAKTGEEGMVINVNDERSIIHIGSLDSYDTTEKGILGAKMLINVLNTKNKEDADETVKYYDTIIPKENFGGEYTALQWFCKYVGATSDKKQEMLKDPLTKAYYEYLGDGDYKLLKNYVLYKYKLIDRDKISVSESIDNNEEKTKEIGRTKRAFIEDFILFDNPMRESWEKSSEIMSRMPIKKGDTVIDLGSGSGYYSYKFSKIVGDTGKVYSIDTKSGHLDFINSFAKKNNINNIKTIKPKSDQGYTVPEKGDYVFLCSLYHIVYGVFSHNERERFVQSIVNSLKDDGRLVLVDNSPVDDETLPYHGPFISKDLIISQLSYYGFELEKFYQIIPQRYVMIFRKKSEI